MNSLKEEIQRLKALKKTNEDRKYIKQSEVIEEKIKENNKQESILKSFSDIEKEREEWFKNQKNIFQPSLNHKTSSSQFFNFKKCEKPLKPNINIIKVDIVKPNEKNEKNDKIHVTSDVNSLISGLRK